MKNVSFGKERDCPIPKRKDEGNSDDDDLDLEDDNDINEKEKNKLRETNKGDSQYKEIELNPNDPKNIKVIFSSASEDDDSDKTSSDEEKKNSKNKNDKKGKEEDEKEEEDDDEENDKKKDEKYKNRDKKKEYKEDKNEKDSDKKEKKRNSDNEDNQQEEEKENQKLKNKNEIDNSGDEEFSKEIKKNKEIENILLESIKNKENATSQKIHMANEIDFKRIPDKIIATDEYGFLLSKIPDETTPEASSRISRESNKPTSELLLINARLEKWNYMIQHYDEFSKKKYSKLKSRTRKGVPDCLRSYIWQIFAEKDKYYEKDIFNKLDSIPLSEDIEIVIIKDLDRTFPACQFFKEKYGDGQRKLYKVLSSYSKYNTATGYVQGMGFIVAVFLTYMDEESSFFMLHSLMKKYALEGFYKPNFPELKKTFYILLNLIKKFVPKVYELFKKEGMMPSMYASEWFICIFSRNLGFNTLVRIFDVFLLEGYKVIYRFALAFLKMKEDKFLQGKDGLASIMQTLNECTEDVDVEKLFKISFAFSISRKYIDNLGKEYDSVKDDQKNEFVQQL